MTECFSNDQINRFLAAGRSDEDEQRLSRHLQQCAACRELLERKTAIPDSLQKALADDTPDEDTSPDAALDHLVNVVHHASTVDGVFVDGDTDRNDATIAMDGGPAPMRAAPSTPAIELPGYEVLEEIGRGGLGVVFRARQTALGRIVAIKMLLPRSFTGREDLARFRLEAEAVAKLKHPNVVQVFDIVEGNGNPCLCMECVEGGSLSERLDGKPQSPNTAAHLVEILARAIHAVHKAGFLHRDLKPANILLSPAEPDSGLRFDLDDDAAEYVQPKVTDFGLAKRVAEDNGLTNTNAIVGTASYMSPEQVQAGASVNQTTDVYSLGAILYEALVGRPPLLGSSPLDTMGQVVHQEPVPPRRLVANLSADLEAVCLKCLEKEPERRYPSAEALANDLRRFQDGRPTVARPMTSAERLWRWCRRHPFVPLLLVVAVLGGLILQSVYIEQQSATRAEGLVDALLRADIAQVPGIVEDMRPYRKWAAPLLNASFEQAGSGSSERLHSALAMLPVDENKVDYLRDRLHLVTRDQFPVVRDSLLLHKDKVTNGLWSLVQDEQLSAAERFQVAAALAQYSPSDERWKAISPFVAQHLTSVVSIVSLDQWLQHLQPASQQLALPLAAIHADRSLSERKREAAAHALADFWRQHPDNLTDAILNADRAVEFMPLIAALRPHSSNVIEGLRDEMLAPMPEKMLEPMERHDPRLKQRDAHWKRRSMAAVTLAQLGQGKVVWPLLKISPDPSLRSFIIHHLGKLQTDPGSLADQLQVERDVSIRRALIQSLGGLDATLIPRTHLDRIGKQLVVLYTDDVDPGVHGSAAWTLRQWSVALPELPVGEKVMLDADQQRTDALRGEVADIRKRRTDNLDGFDAVREGVRRWYVNSQGQTMVVLPRTSKSEESDIDYAFAISSHEVTVSEFLRFRQAHEVDKFTAPSNDCPVHSVTWFDAAYYCNWLSEQDEIPKDQWIYERNADGNFLPGMTIKEDYRTLEGYRLPSDAEWEYACRAGTSTCYSCGEPTAFQPTIHESPGVPGLLHWFSGGQKPSMRAD